MTDAEKIKALEERIEQMELRLAARMDVVLSVSAAIQGVTIDALALLALRDRAMVEKQLQMRRLTWQNSLRQGKDTATLEGLLVQRFEMALSQADMLAASGDLGPR